MADSIDALGLRLGIPAQLIPAWRQQVAPAAPAPAPPPAAVPAPGPRPGDPGWSLAPQATPMAAPTPPAIPAPPPGPRPGDPGFNVTQLAPAAPPSMPAPSAKPGAPSKPMTREEAMRNIQGTNDEFAKLQNTGGPAPLTLTGEGHRRLLDAAKGTEENIKNAFKAEENRKNLDGATFAEPGGGAAMSGVAAAGRPFMVSPGGRRPASWAVQEGAPVSSREQGAADSADTHERKAASLEYSAGQAQANYERGYLDRLEGAHANHAEEQARRADAYEKEYSKHVSELDNLRQQIRESKVDPTGGLGGAGRLAGAVAMALGAFGSKRGENMGLEAVKHTIAENIRQQEAQIDRLDRGSKAEVNFLGTLKQKYGDIEHAKDAAWIGMLEKSKVELAKILGSPDVRDPQLQAKYERMLDATDKELEQRYARWDERTRDKVVRHDVNAPAQYAGGGLDMKHAREDAKWLAEKYDAAKIPEALATLEGVDQTIDTFGNGDIEGVGKLAQYWPNSLSTDRAVANRQKWQGLKNQIGHGLFGGALSPTEAENLSKQLDGAHDGASLRRVVQDFRTMIHHKQRNLAGGVGAGAKLTYDQQGGSVKPFPLDKPASPYVKEAKWRP